MTKASSHNGYLDFLKFVFALGVMGIHTSLADFSFTFLDMGYLGVDFFFMVSGYFAAQAAEKKRLSIPEGEPRIGGVEKYFWKRVKGFYPFFLAGCIYSFAAMCFVDGLQPLEVVIDIYRNIFDFIPLQMQGFQMVNPTGVEWYVSAMFIVAPLTYGLVFRFGKAFTRFAAPVVAGFLLGFLELQVGSLGNPGVMIGEIVFAGMLRSIADMFLGSTIYEIAQHLSVCRLTSVGKAVVKIVRILCLAVIVLIFCFDRTGYRDFAFVLIMFGYLCLLFAYPVTTKLFQNPVSTELGKISMMLFLVHIQTGRLVNIFLKGAPVGVQLAVFYLGSIFVAYLLYYAVVWMRKTIHLRRLLVQ